ncbi:DUF932 domain-containing protein [Desulfatitalea tepidiphila]|uniref:DUF932 domain-containing protein n=1 Tax=Desulfatitalea tepidiphila TaxID=1185843 RepID=UPI0006B64E68|nr:DUF932 domain-containing protein [Desulfatitalea tepidiphila]
MKQGKTLQELAGEVQRISEAKKDFIADTREMKMQLQAAAPAGTGAGLLDEIADNTRGRGGAIVEEIAFNTMLMLGDKGRFGINDNAHRQIAAWADVPWKYYERMRGAAPHLLASNVNHWMQKEPKRRMVRTLDGSARAFLSDRYRILDNDEILEHVLPVLADLKVRFESCDVTPGKLYLKCTFPTIEGEVKKGDVVRAGFILSNSEVGHGSVNVQPLVLRLVCTNGAVFNDMGMKKYHVGRIAGEGRDAQQFFKDDTLKADDQAFLLKLRDTIKATTDEVVFNSLVEKMRDAGERRIEGDAVAAVEVVQKKIGLGDGERASVLTHLIQGGDLTQYGMANAVTRMSQDVENYDRASELERAGGSIIEMQAREWREIAKAA